MDFLNVLSLDELALAVNEWRKDGAIIVHAHGCFDPLHLGHVLHLAEAKRLGNVLIVTVTADEYVNKGPGRPKFGADVRAKAIAELRCVDAVAVAHTRRAPVGILRPHVYVKGSEFTDNLTPPLRVEKLEVESYGGRVEFISGEAIYSSTALLAGAECPTPMS